MHAPLQLDVSEQARNLKNIVVGRSGGCYRLDFLIDDLDFKPDTFIG